MKIIFLLLFSVCAFASLSTTNSGSSGGGASNFQVNGVVVSLGQTVMTSSLPVVLSSNQSGVPVTGAFPTPPPSQAVTGAFPTPPASQAVTGAFPTPPATQTVSGTVTVTPPTLTKGTQGSTGFSVQNLLDAGRTYLSFIIDRITGVTVEALASMTVDKGGATVVESAYTVTSGKTLRLTSLGCATEATSTTTGVFGRARVRHSTAGAVGTASAIAIGVDIPSGAATVGAGTFVALPIPDGLEIAAGQSIAISQILNSTSSTLSCTVTGFEY